MGGLWNVFPVSAVRSLGPSRHNGFTPTRYRIVPRLGKRKSGESSLKDNCFEFGEYHVEN